MITKDTLYTADEARTHLIAGIRKCAAAVGSTMGTGGSNSLIEANATPGHLSTNDGATILDAIRLAHPIEEMGRKILLEAVSRANKASGDGSSTTCVLTAAILEEGLKHIKDVSPMEIKRSLEACIPLIEEALKAQTHTIDIDKVGAVAAISAEDDEIGATIQEIYQQIGKDGIVYWDISKTDKDSYTIGKGITVDGAGIASPYMCDREQTTGSLLNIARLTNPLVLITKEKLTSAAVFEQLFYTLNNQGKKEVVIFCDDFEVQVIAQFVATHQVQGFRTVVIKMPVLWKDLWYEDLAIASGATIVDPAAGLPLRDATMEHLGTFTHLTVDKDTTYIDGIKDVSAHIAQLSQNDDEHSALRVARLNTQTARYFVGAHSDSALSYRRLKVEDAIAAAHHALNGGIVAGGGVALRNVADQLQADTIATNILLTALKAPYRQILSNAGLKDAEALTPESGYDSRTKQAVNMFDAGITDPTVILANACRNAISVAASVLTCNTLVLLPREEQQLLPNMPIL